MMKDKLKVFEKIKFDGKMHKYFVDGEEYISTTTFLKKYKNSSTWAEWEDKVRKEMGLSVEDYKKIQDVKLKYYGVRGTELHLYIELFNKCGFRHTNVTDIHNNIKNFHEFHNKYKDRFKFLYNEVIIADFNNKIAGTIDCIALDLKDNKYFLIDWKSNEKISADTYNPETFKLPPLDSIPDSTFYDYSLQLSVYEKILLNNGIEVKGSIIIQLPTYKPYNIIKISNVKTEVDQLFK